MLQGAAPQAALPHQNSPRTLLNASDITRMKNWVATYSWAASLRDQIISNADAWPSKYMSDYNLTNPDLPPSGGHSDGWYLCPDGTYLRYVPTHSPPHYCPSTGQYYASPPQWPNWPWMYDKVIYERRHLALAQYAMYLGLAYQLTGNTTYASNTANILRAYSTVYLTYPLHTDDPSSTWQQSAARATGQTLDESIWLINLAWAYDLIMSSGVLTSADQNAIADGLLRPATTVIKGNNHGLSNWQAWHNTAMTITALIFDDLTTVADRFNNSTNGFFTHLAQGAAADGFWWENSWGYHFFTLKALVYMAEMGARNGLDSYTAPNLRKMLTAPLQMAAPDLTLPPFNDSGTYWLAASGDRWVYEAGYNRYRDSNMAVPLVSRSRPWQALLWGSASLPATSATAPTTSVLFPQAGYAALRAGTDDPRYLAFDFGPHGGWHGHYDKLGYVSFGLGKTLATDPSTHSYSSSLHDAWDRTTVAHNTVVVDEHNQAEATGNLHRYIGLPSLSVATADAGSAYPNRATSARTLALTADYWLDVTRATTLDSNTHRYDWVYHSPGSLSTSLALTPYSSFPTTNGYNYLTKSKSVTTSADWQATWDSSGIGKPYGSYWCSKDGITASFTITNAVATNGALSGQMDYNFGAVSDGYIIFGPKTFSGLPNEVPTRIGVDVYGDGSNNKLTLRIYDATGEKFGKDFGNINWTGWQKVELVVDNTWWHGSGSGDDDGIMDTPVSQVVLQVSLRTGAARSGRLFADEIALTFPVAGKQTVEDFESALVRMRMTMLGAPSTTVVLGDGIDSSNQTIPFAMSRRQGTNATSAAIFEPYRQSPRVTSFQMLSVTPALGSRSAFRASAPGVFTDSLLLADDDIAGDRAFGSFDTDAAVAYIRQDAASNLQTLVLANGTKLSDGSLSLFTSTVPITLQVTYAGSTVLCNLPTVPTTQLRLYAPTAQSVIVNNLPVLVQRDGQYLLVALPSDAVYLYLPLLMKNR
jgi:hypothetical protein